MMHRDAISLVGAGGNLLHRRVQPERHVEVGIWMLCHEAHYYYHWLYDVCSRSLAYGHFGAFPAGSSILVDEAALAIPQLVEILQLLNPCGLDVQSIASGEAVRVERLFVAAPAVWNGFNFRKNAPVQATDNVFHPEAVPALRRLANPHLSRLQPGRRIFISRRGAPNPRLTNEADLAAMVEEEFGFELLDPSAMTFGEQVRAFSEAELIVAATGAALASLAFCSKGSRALVLMPRKLDLSFWQSIGAASGCEVTHMVGQLLPAPGPHKNLFTIEANQLRTGLHEALRTSGLAGAA
jgi:capsular polysaccharide biosynthesis protein